MKRTLVSAVAALAVVSTGAAGPGDDGHMREELGVNAFTAPALGSILTDLAAFEPSELAETRRPVGTAVFSDRAQVALNMGAVIAEGLVVVVTRDRRGIEPIGRELIRLGETLGVGTRITRRGRSFMDLAAHGSWPALRAELIQAQGDVEEGLMELRDEEIAHLISLGGWLRGLEITSRLTATGYTPERAAGLARPELLDYFADRVSTLSPRLESRALFQEIEKQLTALRPLLGTVERPPEVDAVREIARRTRELNERIAASGR